MAVLPDLCQTLIKIYLDDVCFIMMRFSEENKKKKEKKKKEEKKHTKKNRFLTIVSKLSRHIRKLTIWVSDQTIHKPVCSVTE